MALYHSLIHTHSIAAAHDSLRIIRQTAIRLQCFALVRVDGSPGMIYCQGGRSDVVSLVSAIYRLRIKEFRVLANPTPLVHEAVPEFRRDGLPAEPPADQPGFEEVQNMRQFAAVLRKRRVFEWFRSVRGDFYE